MKSSDNLVDIRSIQQYLYCPHRWGLIEIDCSFTENIFVVKGDLVHDRVNSGQAFSSKGVIHENTVRVYNDDWGIFGVLDCIELSRSSRGTYIAKYGDKYEATIVEYKLSAPKKGINRPEDVIQILAQKICVDSLFGCDCKCCFYYDDTKKRAAVTFSLEDYELLKLTLQQINTAKENGIIPPVRKSQNCSGCSMKDICLPNKSEV